MGVREGLQEYDQQKYQERLGGLRRPKESVDGINSGGELVENAIMRGRKGLKVMGVSQEVGRDVSEHGMLARGQRGGAIAEIAWSLGASVSEPRGGAAGDALHALIALEGAL
ncbi:hypothetical protein Tco_0575605 [Tanacetum coccineum]